MIPLVYLGPSLPRREAEQLLRADYRPPVRRGDLPRRYDGPVVIIDGEFGQSLAVSPNEILRLLDAGTPVFGAASMGALRAAELHPYGMQGHGWIFEAYRSGLVEADDEVALLYSPRDFHPLTVPLINVRRWLAELRTAGRINARTERALLGRARRIFFADRTPERLRQEWAAAAGDLPADITDAKAADARSLLAALNPGGNDGGSPEQPEPRLHRTHREGAHRPGVPGGALQGPR